jgi:AAA+ superfamily predicted ATPase
MQNQLINYVKAGYPALYIVTHEEARAECEIIAAANAAQFELFSWSLNAGIFNMKDNHPITDTELPEYALDKFNGLPERSILLMRDLHLLWNDNPALIRRCKDAARLGKSNSRVLIVTACRMQLPPELEKEFTIIDFKLPSKDQLCEVLREVANPLNLHLNGQMDQILDAAGGLTTNEAENAFALSFIEAKTIDPRIVAREKANTIRKNGILEIVDTRIDLESIGGLDLLKSWLLKRKTAFGADAIQYGLPTPKGFLMAGIPGCGKSLTAKATAKILNVPLLKLDAGKIFGSLVGESERNIRSAIQTAEAIAPCVLWIDEFEKAFAGSKSSGATDGGTTSRVFGSFLNWMQEKTASVFIVATANDISALPPELLRAGRWDKLFFVDLPDQEEREQIWSIQIAKFKRDPKDFDLKSLARLSDGWTGAEIETCFTEALFEAFEDNKKEPTDLTISLVSKGITPLSQTMRTEIEALRNWAHGRATRASTPKAQNTTTRKIAA